MKPTFAAAFCVSYTRHFHPKVSIVIQETENGVELLSSGEPLLLRAQFILGNADRQQWCRLTAERIDNWVLTIQQPHDPMVPWTPGTSTES